MICFPVARFIFGKPGYTVNFRMIVQMANSKSQKTNGKCECRNDITSAPFLVRTWNFFFCRQTKKTPLFNPKHIHNHTLAPYNEVIAFATCDLLYCMRLNFHRNKLSWIENLLNIRGFYFHGCWERIIMVDHLVLGKLRN